MLTFLCSLEKLNCYHNSCVCEKNVEIPKKLNECLERGALDCNKLNCLHLKKLFVRSKVNCVWTHLYLFETRAISNGVVTDNLQWLCFYWTMKAKCRAEYKTMGRTTQEIQDTHTLKQREISQFQLYVINISTSKMWQCIKSMQRIKTKAR